MADKNITTSLTLDISQTPTYMYVYAAIFGTAATLGTFGNVIDSMRLTKSLRTMRDAFIISLSCSDLLVCTVLMPATFIGVLKGKEWTEDHWIWCKFTSIICGPACMASMYSCVMIAFTRYCYISKHPKYLAHFTNRMILFYVCVLWVFCVVICLPNHFGWGTIKFSPVLYFCWLDTSTYSYLAFYTAIKIIATCLALHFYIKIYLIIRKSTLSKQLIVGKKEKDEVKGLTEQKIAEELKVIKVTFKIFILFAVCWVPLTVLFLLTIVWAGPQWLYLCATILGHSNSTLNFMVYFVDNNVFRSAVIDCIRKKQYQTAVVAISATSQSKISNVRVPAEQ